MKQGLNTEQWYAREKSRRAQRRAINQVANEHALTVREIRSLRIYLNGDQTSAEFDALSAPLQAAVDAVTREIKIANCGIYTGAAFVTVATSS